MRSLTSASSHISTHNRPRYTMLFHHSIRTTKKQYMYVYVYVFETQYTGVGKFIEAVIDSAVMQSRHCCGDNVVSKLVVMVTVASHSSLPTSLPNTQHHITRSACGHSQAISLLSYYKKFLIFTRTNFMSKLRLFRDFLGWMPAWNDAGRLEDIMEGMGRHEEK